MKLLKTYKWSTKMEIEHFKEECHSITDTMIIKAQIPKQHAAPGIQTGKLLSFGVQSMTGVLQIPSQRR